MNETTSDRVAVELSQDEARLVVAALRQFEPYWPADVDAFSRAELLAGIRTTIGHLTTTLSA